MASIPSVSLWCNSYPSLCPPCRCGAPTTLPPETRRRRKACRSATSLYALRAAVVHLPPCHRKHAGGGKHAAALHPSAPSVPLWYTYHPVTGNTPGEENMPQHYIPLCSLCLCGAPSEAQRRRTLPLAHITQPLTPPQPQSCAPTDGRAVLAHSSRSAPSVGHRKAHSLPL